MSLSTRFVHARGPRRWAMVAFLAPAAASAYEFRDPLREGTAGHAQGGRFDAEGWHVDDRRDRIWFELPRLVEGSLAFTVAGIRPENLVLADHEIFAMYEAGYGIAEPIAYNPAFRGNHYKCMLRIYGQPEPDRLGAQKLMWGLCPSGAPGYGDCGCGSFFEEPFGGEPTWDGSPSRIRVEWGGGVTRLIRDEAVALTIDWSESGLAFGPSALHFTLGSPRAADVDDAGLPVGAVFSDLVVTGVEGALAECPGGPVEPPGPDAGPPGQDATAPPPVGEGLLPTDDVTVAVAFADAVFPDVNDLAVESVDGAVAEVAYLRFDVPHPVRRAVLRLTARGGDSAEGDGATVHAVADTDWNEETLTFAARPVEAAASLGNTGPTAPGGVYEVDVTAGARPGVLAFALRGGSDGSHFSSKEDLDGAAAPRLLVEYAPDGVEPPDASMEPGGPGSDVGPGVPGGPDGMIGGDAALGSGPDRPGAEDASVGPGGGPGGENRADAELGSGGDGANAGAAEGRGDCNCRAVGGSARGAQGLWFVGAAMMGVAGLRCRRRTRGPGRGR